ncbi:MAG TPA: hypothetical protein VHT73_08625 [Thermodesulfobacteriota bacterium]|nr:hypothetical protein [Thermodesulfobacteriota bacterium]
MNCPTKRRNTRRWIASFKVVGILTTFIAVLTFGYFTSLLAEDYNSMIEKGDKYYEQFNNLKALEEYKKAYQLSPNSFEALMKLTRAYNDVGEDIKGIRFRQEDKVIPDKAGEYFEKSTQYAELLHKKFPDKAQSYFFLAVTYGNLAIFKGGKEKVRLARDVEKNAKKTIEIDPEFAPAYIVLGVYYRRVADLNWFLKQFAKTVFGGLPNGTNEDSEKMLLKAIELDPQIIYAHYELVKTYEAIKKEDKAKEHLKKILELPVADHQDEAIKKEAERELERLGK